MRIVVNGCNGKMGKEVADLIQKELDMQLIGGIDKKVEISSFPVYDKIEQIKGNIDCIVDFSVPKATMEIVEYASYKHIPIVIATTGFSEAQKQKINEKAKEIPIFMSVNFSYEITLMSKIAQFLVLYLKQDDIEIIETHHSKKIDAPSGTALLLAENINRVLKNKLEVVCHQNNGGKVRSKNEIGISSIRGGNIVGEHSVQFFGENETFEIKHTAYSRNIYANGAIKAIRFITSKENGLYDMQDII